MESRDDSIAGNWRKFHASSKRLRSDHTPQRAPDAKRHQRQDTNHRYDTMMKTMSLTSIYPRRKKRRLQVDPPSILQKGTRPSRAACCETPGNYLAGNSTLKANTGSNEHLVKDVHVRTDFEDQSSQAPYSSVSKVPTVRGLLPEWLAQTFATLPREHPLRCLLPTERYVADSPDSYLFSDFTCVETICQSPLGQDQPFFSFEGNEAPTSPTLVPSKLNPDSDSADWKSTCSGPLPRSPFVQSEHAMISTLMRPFACPGPASTISRPPVPAQLTFDDVGVDLVCSPQTPHRGSFTRGHYISAAGLGVPTPTSPIPLNLLMEVQPKDFLLADAFGSHIGDFAFPDLSAPSAPRYRAPSMPVFFDSPVEDCLSSNSSLESAGFNVGDLDFQWTAFDRSGLHEDRPPHPNLDSGDAEFFREGSNRQFPNERSPSPDDTARFRFQAT